MEHQQGVPKLIRFPRVREITGQSKSYLYLAMSRGNFPRPVKSGRSSLWVEAEVLGHVQRLIDARDGVAQ